MVSAGSVKRQLHDVTDAICSYGGALVLYLDDHSTFVNLSRPTPDSAYDERVYAKMAARNMFKLRGTYSTLRSFFRFGEAEAVRRKIDRMVFYNPKLQPFFDLTTPSLRHLNSQAAFANGQPKLVAAQNKKYHKWLDTWRPEFTTAMKAITASLESICGGIAKLNIGVGIRGASPQISNAAMDFALCFGMYQQDVAERAVLDYLQSPFVDSQKKREFAGLVELALDHELSIGDILNQSNKALIEFDDVEWKNYRREMRNMICEPFPEYVAQLIVDNSTVKYIEETDVYEEANYEQVNEKTYELDFEIFPRVLVPRIPRKKNGVYLPAHLDHQANRIRGVEDTQNCLVVAGEPETLDFLLANISKSHYHFHEEVYLENRKDSSQIEVVQNRRVA